MSKHGAYGMSNCRSYLDEGIHLLELARCARSLFEKQKPQEKRRLIDFVVPNGSWMAGTLTVTFRQPFDILAKAMAAAAPPEEHQAMLQANL